MFGKKKQYRVNALILRDGMWSTHFNRFYSEKEKAAAEAKYKEIQNEWRSEIKEGTFHLDFDESSH